MPLYCGYGFSACAIVPVKFANGIAMLGNTAWACASVVALRVWPSSGPSVMYCSGIWLVNGPALPAPGRKWPELPL